MSTIQENRAKIEERIQWLKDNLTPEECAERMKELLERLRSIGKEYATESQAYGNDCKSGNCEV